EVSSSDETFLVVSSQFHRTPPDPMRFGVGEALLGVSILFRPWCRSTQRGADYGQLSQQLKQPIATHSTTALSPCAFDIATRKTSHRGEALRSEMRQERGFGDVVRTPTVRPARSLRRDALQPPLHHQSAQRCRFDRLIKNMRA